MKACYYIIKLAVVIFFIGLVACEKENNEILYNQKIFFEHFSINYAWGLHYVHWIIDNEGNVRINSKADSLIWINENNLDDIVNSFDSVIYNVGIDELYQYIDFISLAANGKIVCEDQHRADFGGTVFNCFYCGKIILLSSMSDIEDCSNKNRKAIKIDDWLKNIYHKIYSKN